MVVLLVVVFYCVIMCDDCFDLLWMVVCEIVDVEECCMCVVMVE